MIVLIVAEINTFLKIQQLSEIYTCDVPGKIQDSEKNTIIKALFVLTIN